MSWNGVKKKNSCSCRHSEHVTCDVIPVPCQDDVIKNGNKDTIEGHCDVTFRRIKCRRRNIIAIFGALLLILALFICIVIFVTVKINHPDLIYKSPSDCKGLDVRFVCELVIRNEEKNSHISSQNINRLEAEMQNTLRIQVDEIFNNSKLHRVYLSIAYINLSLKKRWIRFELNFQVRSDLECRLGSIVECLEQDILSILSSHEDYGLFIVESGSIKLHQIISTEPERIYIPICGDLRYNTTCYPNSLQHSSQQDALMRGLSSLALLDTYCHPSLRQFICTLLAPDCSKGRPLPLCRSLCTDIEKECGNFTEFHDLISSCDIFPDSDDDSECQSSTAALPDQDVTIPNECRSTGDARGERPNLLRPSLEVYYWQQLQQLYKSGTCEDDLQLFSCSYFYPQYNSLGNSSQPSSDVALLKPCRSFCTSIKEDCGFFFHLLLMKPLLELDCNVLPDDSDQEICVKPNLVIESTTNKNRDVCDSDQFSCGDGQCISGQWLCDGQRDCENSNDEEYCANCGNKYRCRNGLCLERGRVCDGVRDCFQGEDESDCVRTRSYSDNELFYEIYNSSAETWESVCLPANSTCIHTRRTIDGISVSLDGKSSAEQYKRLQKATNCERYQPTRVSCNYDECIAPRISRNSHAMTSHSAASNNAIKLETGDLPWLVSLHGGPKQAFYCGGVYLAAEWVLTAAHCAYGVIGQKDWTVRGGQSRLTAFSSVSQSSPVLEIHVHPEYSVNTLDNDIALLKLAQPFKAAPSVRPICLPPREYRPPFGATCYVAGWGKELKTNLKFSDQIRLKILTVRSDVPHNETYRDIDDDVQSEIKTHLNAQTDLENERFIITAPTYPPQDTCQGDSGSAVLCLSTDDDDEDIVLHLAGIVSQGTDCGNPGIPATQTAVAYYVPWIKNITGIH